MFMFLWDKIDHYMIAKGVFMLYIFFLYLRKGSRKRAWKCTDFFLNWRWKYLECSTFIFFLFLFILLIVRIKKDIIGRWVIYRQMLNIRDYFSIIYVCSAFQFVCFKLNKRKAKKLNVFLMIIIYFRDQWSI